MLTVCIGVIGFVVIYAAVGSGEWVACGIAVVILLLLMLMSSVERKEARAWWNRTDYWARGGPDRKRVCRRSAVRQSEGRAGRVSARERREAEAKRAAYAESLRSGSGMSGRRDVQGAAVCHYCGRFVRAGGWTSMTTDGPMRTYYCPVCGRVNMTKLGR